MKRAWDVIGPLLIGLLLGWAVFQGIQAHQLGQAVCTLRTDLEHRVAASYDFLKHHPKGIPGIPRAVLLKSIADQKRTIHALKPLTC